MRASLCVYLCASGDRVAVVFMCLGVCLCACVCPQMVCACAYTCVIGSVCERARACASVRVYLCASGDRVAVVCICLGVSLCACICAQMVCVCLVVFGR